MPQIYDMGTDDFTSRPKEGVLRIFSQYYNVKGKIGAVKKSVTPWEKTLRQVFVGGG